MKRGASSVSRTSAGLWTEIGDRVFVRRYHDFNVNIGLVGGDDAWLLVDTRASDRQGRELAAEVSWMTTSPLIVVNTHHHFDHAFGNSAFLPSEIWSHERCVSRLRDDGRTALVTLSASMPEVAAEYTGTAIVTPTRTFRVKMAVGLGGRSITMEHFGRGHTDNDIAVVVHDAGVIFAGDLVEQGGPPSFYDSFPMDWPGTLERLLQQVHGPVVPGHGEIVDAAFCEGQRAEIASLADLARGLRFEGRPIEEGLASAAWPADTSRVALARALAQLDGEI